MFLHDLVDPMASLTLLSELMNYDFSGMALDAPITDELIESVSGIRGLVQNLRTHIGDQVTLADLAGHRATLLQGPRFVGTGPEVADQMEDWMESPRRATVSSSPPPTARAPTRTWCGWSSPSSSAGRVPDRYTGATLRDNLGLAERPKRRPVPEEAATPARLHGLRGRRHRHPGGRARWRPPPSPSSVPRSSRWSSRARATPCAPGVSARTASGLVWKSVSRNKRCVTLDLRHNEGQELFHQLLDVSDVVVFGNRPSALERWGLD